MLKAIIFDFDGTILDTESPEFESWRAVFSDHGSELELEVWCQIVGTSWDYFNPFDYLEEKTGLTVDRDNIRRLQREKFYKMIADKAPLPGVESALAASQDMGLKLAVASSSPGSWVNDHLERLGLRDYFEVVKTADDVEKVKPDPALYVDALVALDVSADATMAFEDSVNGVKAAKAAGITCIAIPNAITRNLDFTHADCTLNSLIDCDLHDLFKTARTTQISG